MHITLIALVALNELWQQGHIYFLVLDGFVILGVAVGVADAVVDNISSKFAYQVNV